MSNFLYWLVRYEKHNLYPTINLQHPTQKKNLMKKI